MNCNLWIDALVIAKLVFWEKVNRVLILWTSEIPTCCRNHLETRKVSFSIRIHHHEHPFNYYTFKLSFHRFRWNPSRGTPAGSGNNWRALTCRCYQSGRSWRASLDGNQTMSTWTSSKGGSYRKITGDRLSGRLCNTRGRRVKLRNCPRPGSPWSVDGGLCL